MFSVGWPGPSQWCPNSTLQLQSMWFCGSADHGAGLHDGGAPEKSVPIEIISNGVEGGRGSEMLNKIADLRAEH